MKNIQISKLIYCLIPALLLSPILLFQISNDLSIYITAGKIISQGGRIYVDYIDLKPPLFYYFYSIIYKLTGGTEFNLRLFDFFWQLAAIFVLYKVSFKLFNNRAISYLTTIVYSITYTCLSNVETMHPESFSGLLLLMIIYLELNNKKSAANMTVQGILIGFLIAIKFTFGIVLFSLLISDILYKNNYKGLVKKYTIFGLTSFFIIILSFLPFIDHEICSGFKNVMAFLQFYGSQPGYNIGLIKFSLKNFSNLFSDHYSLFLSVIMGIGVFRLFKGSADNRQKNIILILTITLFLIISIIIEKKFTLFHFSRNYTLFAILSAYGLYFVFRESVNIIKQKKLLLLLIIPLCGIMVLLSPITRYVNILIPSVYYFTDRQKFNNITAKSNESNIFCNTSKEISSYLNARVKKTEHVIVMSIGGNIINYGLTTGITSKFSQSCFYFSNIDIPDWNKEINKEIKIADYIVINTDDRHPILTGHNFSTYEKLKQNKEMLDYFTQNFILEKEFKPYLIFRRK